MTALQNERDQAIDTNDGGSWWICGRRHGAFRFRRISGPYPTENDAKVLGFMTVNAFLRSVVGNKGLTLWWTIAVHQHPQDTEPHPRLPWEPR